MRRGLWFVAGAGAGVYAMVRGRRAAEAFTADGLRDRWQRARPRGAAVPRRGRPGPGREGNRVARALRARASWTRAAHAADRHRAAAPDRHDPTTQEGNRLMDTAEIRRRFVAHFERSRRTPPCPRRRCCSTTRTCCSSTPAWCRSSPTSSARRRRRTTARGERAEVRAHPGHRGRRQDHPARHVLRDVRQLLLRRLLQGRRDRARLGPGHQAAGRRRLGPRGEPALPVDPTTTTTRRCELWSKVTGLPDDRIVRLGQKENYWSMGVPGPGRPVLGDPLRPRARRTAADGDFGAEDRYLEFWNLVFMQDELSAVRAKDDFDIVGSLPQQEHRHRHGPRAGRVPAPGQ